MKHVLKMQASQSNCLLQLMLMFVRQRSAPQHSQDWLDAAHMLPAGYAPAILQITNLAIDIERSACA